jgi:hypothetical protein
MKWLNTYNNILFAFLGTLAIVVLLIGALASLVLYIGSGEENFGITQDPIEKDEGLVNNDEENIRYYLGDPELIDSSYSIYMIPVYKPEADESFSKYSSSSYRSGLSINLIIHDIEKNVVKRLFNELVLIRYSDIFTANDRIYIEVVYSDKDTNNNDIIDYDDKKSIALYDLLSDTFNTIPLNNKFKYISSQYDENLNALIIVGENYAEDEQSEYHYYRYAFATQKVFELESPM